MPTVLTDCGIFLGGHDLSCDANTVAFDVEVAALDSTTFCSDGWTRNTAGLKSATFSAEGLYDAGLNQVDPHLFTNLGVATTPVGLTLTDPDVQGAVGWLFDGLQHKLSWGGAVGELRSFTVNGSTGSATTPVVRGQVLHERVARTTTGTGIALNLGATTSTQAMYAGLFVTAVSGTATPTLTVNLQSDSLFAFSTPDAQASFTAATARSAQIISVPGADTDIWWRVTWTITGTNPSFTFTVIAGKA